jgi:small subunit ribosomal protein S9
MEKKSAKYIETIGRRKTSSARVRVTPATKLSVVINDKPVSTYFMTKELETIVKSPFGESSLGDKFEVTAVVKGGGIHSQAEAVRHGISRALVEMSEEERGTLKKAGFLKRDPRSKERRKFGLKKARKSPQWSKR